MGWGRMCGRAGTAADTERVGADAGVVEAEMSGTGAGHQEGEWASGREAGTIDVTDRQDCVGAQVDTRREKKEHNCGSAAKSSGNAKRQRVVL